MKSENYPQVLKKLGKDGIAKLTQAILTIDNPEILAGISRAKMVPAKNSDYDSIAQVAKDLDMLR